LVKVAVIAAPKAAVALPPPTTVSRKGWLEMSADVLLSCIEGEPADALPPPLDVTELKGACVVVKLPTSSVTGEPSVCSNDMDTSGPKLGK
jgi:hypothetical protein